MLLVCCYALHVYPAGPFYLTLTGPPDAFPNLDDPATMRTVAGAVRDALQLGSSYPLSNIIVWVESKQEVATAATRRRLLSTTKVLVLVFNLIKTPDLPPVEELKTIMQTPAATVALANYLAKENFITPEQAGQLSVLIASENQSETIVLVLQGKIEPQGNFVLPEPIGKYTGCVATCLILDCGCHSLSGVWHTIAVNYSKQPATSAYLARLPHASL